MFAILTIGIAISWYIGVIRVEVFNMLATQEYENGARMAYPSDGASNIFALYLGWIPGLVYSILIFGVGKVVQLLIVSRKSNENT